MENLPSPSPPPTYPEDSEHLEDKKREKELERSLTESKDNTSEDEYHQNHPKQQPLMSEPPKMNNLRELFCKNFVT